MKEWSHTPFVLRSLKLLGFLMPLRWSLRFWWWADVFFDLAIFLNRRVREGKRKKKRTPSTYEGDTDGRRKGDSTHEKANRRKSGQIGAGRFLCESVQIWCERDFSLRWFARAIQIVALAFVSPFTKWWCGQYALNCGWPYPRSALC